jgi:hypothetical protein
MSRKLEVARFHRDSGPAALFDRARQVFSDPVDLKLHGKHFQERTAGRQAPVWSLKPFEPTAWELILVEARTDTGKFVSTTWKRSFDGAEWWLVIGFNDTVKTFYEGTPGKLARGRGLTTSGDLWNHVDEVNRKLIGDRVVPPGRADRAVNDSDGPEPPQEPERPIGEDAQADPAPPLGGRPGVERRAR